MSWVDIWVVLEKPVYILAALALITGVFYFVDYLRKQKRFKALAQGADWAYGYAERWGQEYLSGKSDVGNQKFKKALSFLENFASKYGIKVKAEVLEAAIQLAWQKHEGVAKLQSDKAKVEAYVQKALDETIKPH